MAVCRWTISRARPSLPNDCRERWAIVEEADGQARELAVYPTRQLAWEQLVFAYGCDLESLLRSVGAAELVASRGT